MIEIPSQNEMLRVEVCMADLLPELRAVCGEVGRVNIYNG
jgi:hypothetical protein